MGDLDEELKGGLEKAIACLGWGSLVWDSRTLPVQGAWYADGPSLPLEFARQSNDDRMTIVILEDGHRAPALWSKLNVPSLDAAVRALAEREGVADLRAIGRWPDASGKSFLSASTIAEWATAKGLSGVVWTALKPGFRTQRGVKPTLEAVKAHLAGLGDKARAAAREYVERAPEQIATPYREELRAALSGQAGENRV